MTIITGISVSDVDTTNLTVELRALHGKITVPHSSIVSNNGTSEVTLHGPQSELNDALAEVDYQFNAGWQGGDQITITAFDGALNDVTTIDIIAAVKIKGSTSFSFSAIGALQGELADLHGTTSLTFTTSGNLSAGAIGPISPTAITSAGVINSAGLLVRILWIAQVGHPNRDNPIPAWDGTLEDGTVAPTGSYTIKVLAHNITYTWEGAVGNSSPDHTTPRFHAYGSCIRDMCVTDANEIYFTTVYDERIQTVRVTTTSDIQNSDTAIPPQLTRQALIAPHMICSDGTITYFSVQSGPAQSGVLGITCVTKAYYTFSAGTSQPPLSWLSFRTDDAYAAIIKGLAVQKTGNFIFLARPDLSGGTIHVHNKTTGALQQTYTGLTFPARLVSNPLAVTELWVAYSISGGTVSNKVVKCSVDGSGNITPTATVITCQDALGLAISPDGATLLIADGGSSQQVKAFNTSDGSVKTAWATSGVLGTAGGYLNSPTVTNTKFCFQAPPDMGSGEPQTFLAYQPDGKFWIGDVGNRRYLRFSTGNAPAYIDHFSYIPGFYSCQVCRGDPTRVMVGSLEYQIDYSKPLLPSNDSWVLSKNWMIDAITAGAAGNATTGYTSAKQFGVYSNGRAYANWDLPGVAARRFFELTATGLRSTGWNIVPNVHVDETTMDLYDINSAQSGQVCTFKRNAFTGFDGSHNPTWSVNDGGGAGGTTALEGSEVTFTSVTLPSLFPRTRGYDNNAPFPTRRPTANNVIPFFDPNTGDGYGWVSNHFGGLDATTGAVKFNLSYPDPPIHGGNGRWCLFFPDPPAIPYNIPYGGGPIFYMAGHEHIFTNFNGEEWGNNQTNVNNHWHDSGIPIGQFGPAAPYFGAYSLRFPEAYPSGDKFPGSDPYSFLGLAGMAGNCRWGDMAYVGGKYYIYQNDEWYHGGLLRWRVDGLETFSVRNTPVSWNSASYTPVTDPTDMLAGLPFGASLVEGVAGWHRTNADQTSPNLFKITCGLVTIDWRRPDIALETTVATNADVIGDGGSHGAYRALPRVGSGNWTVEGIIVIYPGAGAPENNPFIEGNVYFEILDNTNKCILRFNGFVTNQESGSDTASGGSIKLNASNLFAILPTYTATQVLMGAKRPFSIAANVGAGTMLFQYHTYSATVSIAEAGALIGSPARVQLVYRNVAGKCPFREVNACLTKLRYFE